MGVSAFVGGFDPAVVAVAAVCGGWLGWLLGWGGGVLVVPSVLVEPCGWVGDVLGVFGLGVEFVLVDGGDDGLVGGVFEGVFVGFVGGLFADFAGVLVPEVCESIIV